MKDNSPKDRDGSGMKGGNMHSGLTNHSPKDMDGSGMKGGSVDSEPTRSGVGAKVPTLGPREA